MLSRKEEKYLYASVLYIIEACSGPMVSLDTGQCVSCIVSFICKYVARVNAHHAHLDTVFEIMSLMGKYLICKKIFSTSLNVKYNLIIFVGKSIHAVILIYWTEGSKKENGRAGNIKT